MFIIDFLSYGEETPRGEGPKASNVRLAATPLGDPNVCVAEDDRNRFQIVQAERVGVLPTSAVLYERVMVTS